MTALMIAALTASASPEIAPAITPVDPPVARASEKRKASKKKTSSTRTKKGSPDKKKSSSSSSQSQSRSQSQGQNAERTRQLAVPRSSQQRSQQTQRRTSTQTRNAPKRNDPPPKTTHRAYTGRSSHHSSAHHGRDHRYSRPHSSYLRHHPSAGPPPSRWGYRSWYSHWWVHPYWRWHHATLRVVLFPFVVHAWVDTWTPPPRPGWVWTTGYYVGPRWVPGYWAPTAPTYVSTGVAYVYVPGHWVGDVYVEGYYRARDRPDGDWVWVEGQYTEDGRYVRGHWAPADDAPDGYVWEEGFFDGEEWVEGFWRPARRDGFYWSEGDFDDDGVFKCGYWAPIGEKPGNVWIPGWFDGSTWVEGYWVSESQYTGADPQNWEPEEGWDAGFSDDAPADRVEQEGPKLAIPVPIEEEAQ